MQNVISILRYLRVIVVFIVLQVFALSFYFSSNLYPSIQFWNSTKGLSNQVASTEKFYKKYFGLLDENKRLNVAYLELLNKSSHSTTPIYPDSLRVEDTLNRQVYSYILGEVSRSTVHKANNFITANIGKNHGVKRGMGVINSDGLIGYVFEVSDNHCMVKTLLSENINIDASLANSGQFGLLKWKGLSPNAIQLSGIPNDTKVKNGELVVTRGTGGVFPKGIKVGKVVSKKFIEGEANWDLNIKPSVNFGSVKYIFVVKYLFKQELDELENRVSDL